MSNCIICNTIFVKNRKTHVCCSPKCNLKKWRDKNKDKVCVSNKTYRENNKKNIPIKMEICKICNGDFEQNHKNHMCCTTKCARRYWVIRNQEKIDAHNKRYYQENKKYAREYGIKYYSENTERLKNYSRKYYRKNPEKVKACVTKFLRSEKGKLYMRNRRKTNIEYKISCTLRSRLRGALRGKLKQENTIKLLGCTIEQFREHLESKFVEGMSWDNHGLYGWHIDHIKPCAKFNLENIGDQKECFHYTNMQPLWAEDNIKKGDK